MKTISFNVEQEDLKSLFIDCGGYRRQQNFEMWVHNTYANYEEYFIRANELKRPIKSFSQWVNGQTISHT